MIMQKYHAALKSNQVMNIALAKTSPAYFNARG
jgi:hypothetical protein